MTQAPSNHTDLIATKDLPQRKKLDSQIEAMAQASMGEVVLISEGAMPRLGYPNHEQKASEFLVARLFTDAVFNQDIRAIQTIVNRIDGGLPKDVDVDNYRTLFGDTLAQVMDMDNAERIKVRPDDTVMMALCKSLYTIAVQSIYVNDNGAPKRPTPEQKKERDAAMKLILDRVGGRKTHIEEHKEKEQVGLQSWIKNALPGS